MIVKENVRNFWEKRGEKYHDLPFEAIGNLEPSPELLTLKIQLETEKILPKLNLNPGMRILDLGAGCGQWTFRFAPHVKEVVAVEFSPSMCDIGISEAKSRNMENIRFVNCPAENYICDASFDLVFISGLLLYLTDEQTQALMTNLRGIPGKTTVFVRDGTSILENRHWINNVYSEVIGADYSAIYRTRDEYVTMFSNSGFSHIEDGQMFDEGCPLNKYPETRLWYYVFKK